MAISAPHYHCLKELHRRGELPQGGWLLEIGEANWYGDIPPQSKADAASEWYQWDLVKALYELLFGGPQVVSFDMDGTPAAFKWDLNTHDVTTKPFKCKPMDTVINHGTAEHIFNIANVFKLMHDAAKLGGLMIHESPWTGWPDHGFWSIHPTAYYDLAAANGYDIRYLAVNQVSHGSSVEIHSRQQLIRMMNSGGVQDNSMLYVAMRKVLEGPFQIPMQGYYAGTLSKEAEQAWGTLR